MPHLRIYRLAFAPALATLVVLAFSLQGVPAALDPPPGTLEFDAGSAAKSTRDVLALGETREPGSAEDAAVAELVRERFESVVSGTLATQPVEASIEGEETDLQNVLLSLPGESDHAIVILAGRDSREGEGAPASAAATGVLLELVNELSVAGRNRTLILASTSGASAEAQGAQELLDGLPDSTVVDAVIVISQPGYDEPFGPYVVTSGGRHGPAAGLVRTAEEILADRAMLEDRAVGVPGQIARYAIPAASGEQAALLADGVDAVTLSSAGELPLPASLSDRDQLAIASLERFGQTVLALVSALDAAPQPPASGPGESLRIGGNLVPGWTVSLVVLALIAPAAVLAVSLLLSARRNGERLRPAIGWALEWWLPPFVFLIGLYGLSLAGVIPASSVPYDPARYSLGAGEALVLGLLVALAAWLWWVMRLRRLPASSSPGSSGGAAGLAASAACVLAWLANPYLALVLVPLVHVVCVMGVQGKRPAALALPMLVVASLPLAGALAYVASELGWVASTPWQLSVLVAGAGIGPVEAVGAALVLASAAALVTAALATARFSEI